SPLQFPDCLRILPGTKLSPDPCNPFQHPIRLQLNASVECFSRDSTSFLNLAGQYVTCGEIREGKRSPFDLVWPELVQTVLQRRDGNGWKLEPRCTEPAMPCQPPEIKRQRPGPKLLIFPDCLLGSSESGHCLGGVTWLPLD